MTGEANNIIAPGARVGQVVQAHTFTGDLNLSSAGITIRPAPATEPPVSADYAAFTEQLRSLTTAVVAGEEARHISSRDLSLLREACVELTAATELRN